MKKILSLIILTVFFACNSDDLEPKRNEFGTQILLKDRDEEALNDRYFVFRSIMAKESLFDFNEDGNLGFDILSQFPACAIDDSYFFQSNVFQAKFLGNECEPGISPLEGFNNYFIAAQDESKSSFRLIINKNEDVFQEISIDNFELFENKEGKRTIIGEWKSFDPAFVFDIVMFEIERPD